jgi:hypothetical protein
MTMESSSLHLESSIKHFLVHNNVKDKRIPNSYPAQLQGKIEAYNNKIVKNELFLAVEDIQDIDDDGKLRYDIMFVKAYNETREHGGINDLTPSERFLQERLITSTMHTRTKQQDVTHVGNQECNLSV